MTLPKVDSLARYGGKLVSLLPITDPTTDRSAEAASEAFASVAAATHTAIRAWLRLTTAATTGALVVNAHDAVWGNANAVAPVVARTATGIFTITWPTSVVDELGDAQTLSLRGAFVSLEGDDSVYARAALTAANVVRLKLFTLAGAAATDSVNMTAFVGVV